MTIVLRRLPTRGSLVDRLARCLMVSAITTTLSLTVLLVFTVGFGVRAWVSNVIATALGTGPSFWLNRRWVWQKTGASHPWREVLPFWLLSFAGLVLSTLFVGLVDRATRNTGLSGFGRSVALGSANLAGFGLLWVVQFLLLDRVLFSHKRHQARRASPEHG